jgi:murein DD-endopeptidase MepM/ murein hydrolase activator NlpD
VVRVQMLKPLRASGSAAALTFQLPHLALALWRREFMDTRVILEQGGELRYYSIAGRWQRWAVRTGLVIVGLILALLLMLALSALALHAGKARLEQSHREIYSALVMGTADAMTPEAQQMSELDMFNLARVIHERDMEIRSLVDTATASLAGENAGLKSRLDSSGLTAKTITLIQSAGAVGGFSPEVGSASHSLVRGQFAEEASRNRELKEVMLALPSRVPLGPHNITSRFGIRSHPIAQQPRFHAGIDLVPHSDDRVFPTKAGKVVMARFNGGYGNTVVVRHDRGIESLYAHLDRIDVKEGDEVDVDTLLGLVGNTGASTGKHLHFEISVGGFPVDPLRVIHTANYVQQIQK